MKWSAVEDGESEKSSQLKCDEKERMSVRRVTRREEEHECFSEAPSHN